MYVGTRRVDVFARFISRSVELFWAGWWLIMNVCQPKCLAQSYWAGKLISLLLLMSSIPLSNVPQTTTYFSILLCLYA